MPVKSEFTPDITPSQEGIANTALKYLNSGRYQDILQDANATITFTNKVSEGTNGGFIPSTRLLRVQPQATAEETLNTVLHELTHVMQTDSTGYQESGRRLVSPELQKAAEKAGVSYGPLELEAFTSANLRPGAQARDSSFQQLYSQFPSELRQLYSNTSQPLREPQEHYKGYSEMTPAEKALNTIFGYQPKVKF